MLGDLDIDFVNKLIHLITKNINNYLCLATLQVCKAVFTCSIATITVL